MGKRITSSSPCLLFLFFFFFSLVLLGCPSLGHPNYKDALAKSILFFEGQRSGRLPTGQQITWRSNSGLSDGSLAHVCFFFFFFASHILYLQVHFLFPFLVFKVMFGRRKVL